MGKLTCGLVYGTKLQVSDVEDWLDANCKGDWDVSMADLAVGGHGVAKKLEIYFELPADRDTFKALFAGFEKAKLAEQASGKPSGGAKGDSGGSGGGETKKGGLFGGMMRPWKG